MAVMADGLVGVEPNPTTTKTQGRLYYTSSTDTRQRLDPSSHDKKEHRDCVLL
jgi:hypothetical protein